MTSIETRSRAAELLERRWADELRWAGIVRPYSAEDVIRLRGSLRIDHTLAARGSEKLWSLLHEEPYVPALGALTGNQAVQMVRAGLKAIYLSGWQVAGDAARGRRLRRADGAVRAHRRARGAAAHERRRRARPPVPHRRAHGGGLLSGPGRAGARDRARARLRPVCGRDLVRDLDSRSRG